MTIMTRIVLLAWILTAQIASAGPSFGLDQDNQPTPATPKFNDSRDQVQISVIPYTTHIAPGQDLPVAVIFDHVKGWHIYAADAELPEMFYRTVIEVVTEAESSFTAHTGQIQWPTSHEIDFFGEKFHVYEGRAIAYVPITIEPDAEVGEYTLRFKAAFQSCDDKICLQATPYPPRNPAEEPSEEWLNYGMNLTLNIVPPEQTGDGQLADTAHFEGFDPAVFQRIKEGIAAPELVHFALFDWVTFDLDVAGSGGFLLLLLIAAIGGFLLNLTPCVLPVIPLKIMAMNAHAGHRGKMLLLGTSMSVGVVAFWLALGGVIAAPRVFGITTTNQLFQYPAFTITVGAIIAIMAIGMCGLFSVKLPQFIYRINPGQDSLHGSFGFGIMTAVLSTPCTAPFMGAAAAFAAGIEASRTLMIFAAIGIGMAVPYQILSTFPKLVEKMPKSGPSSELIKQVMGLLMLAAAAYFVGTGVSGLLANPPEPPGREHWWVVAGLGIASGAWLAYRTIRITPRWIFRIIWGGIGLALVVFSLTIGMNLTKKGPIDWVYYTPQRFADAQSAGKVVVMDFTAEWCLNCKAIEASVLHSDRVAAVLAEENVVPIKVDLTGKNVEGNDMLKAVDRLTIPLLVIFKPDGTETLKSDFYTIEQVIEAVREAQS